MQRFVLKRRRSHLSKYRSPQDFVVDDIGMTRNCLVSQRCLFMRLFIQSSIDNNKSVNVKR